MKAVARIISKLTLFVATGFGAGWCPIAPGTFGTLVGVAIAWFLLQLPVIHQGLLIAGMVFLGVPLCGQAAKSLGKTDPGAVVWDEIAAICLMLCGLVTSWPILLTGVILFRILDIAKPWPVNLGERLPGGWGIMADDVLAAILGRVVLELLIRQGIVS